MNDYQANNERPDTTFNLQQLVYKLLRRWYWIAFSLIVCFTVAIALNRYTVPVYRMSASLFVKSANENINPMQLLYGSESRGAGRNLSNEILFLKSRPLIEAIVRELNLNIAYFKEGKVKRSELFTYRPIQISFDTTSAHIPYYQDLKCRILDNHTYTLSTEGENSIFYPEQTFTFGKSITHKDFTFQLNLLDSTTTEKEVIIQLYNTSYLTDDYLWRLNIFPVNKEASVLKIAIEGITPDKEITFLNRLAQRLIQVNLEQKNRASSKTIDFINQLLAQNNDSLSRIESRLESFKSTTSTMDLAGNSDQIASKIEGLQSQKASMLTAQRYFNYLDNHLRTGSEEEPIVLPATLGVNDASLGKTIEELMALQIENKLLKSDKGSKNPYIEVNNQKIGELKNMLLVKVRALKSTNSTSLNEVDQQIRRLTATRQSLPSAERTYVDIQRNYSISESLVQLLMAKRAEAGITQAANESDYMLLEAARVEGPPIKPQPMSNYKIALLLGLAIPIGFIVLLDLLNNKIQSKEELIKLTPIPVLGIVVHTPKPKNVVFGENSKSALSESLRSVRSNLSYLIPTSNSSKIILLTSYISGEGKSFCAKHLSYILSVSGKRTLLINCDLRKPLNDPDLGNSASGPGLSAYLAGRATMDQVIQEIKKGALYFINAGELPPNPSELLMSTRMQQLLTEFRNHFDFIILDSPPIGVVADGLELMKATDINIIVSRQGYTQKSFFAYFNEIYSAQKNKNMAVILNDVNLKNAAYGMGGYGYGYYEEDHKANLWQKMFQKQKV